MGAVSSPRPVARGRLIRSAVVVLLAAVALAGCKSQGSDRALARFSAEAVARTPATSDVAGRPAEPAPAAGSAAHSGNAPQIAARPEAASPNPAGPNPTGPNPTGPDGATPDAVSPPPEVDARPERFSGLAEPALTAALGRPALVRTEGPARVWQYRGRSCVLDLVLYPGPDGPTVRHLEARDPVDAEPRDPAACLEQLLQRRAVAVSG